MRILRGFPKEEDLKERDRECAVREFSETGLTADDYIIQKEKIPTFCSRPL